MEYFASAVAAGRWRPNAANMGSMRHRRRPVLLALALVTGGCGGGAAVGQPARTAAPETLARLAEQADPKSWTDLEPARPGTRLQDPRTGIVFRRVPAGTFTMGGSLTPHEYPPHEVELSRDFLLAETEVTVAQWQHFVDEHGGPSTAPPSKHSPQHPRTHLLFDEAVAFCGTYGYRLPTEAEWEHACRGGLQDAGPWRAQHTLEAHAWFHLNSKDGLRPVATRTANPFGFHDLLGSVWEYCSDHFVSGYGDGARAVDPQGPADGAGHALRGGSWFSMPGPTPAMRSGEDPDPALRRNAFTGFRPARSVG